MTETETVHRTQTETETFKRGLVTGFAMLVVGLTAAVTSWVGWTGLAELCGFSGTLSLGHGLPTLHVSWLVAVSVDLYAMVGFRVWLHGAQWVSDRTRGFARASTFGAIVLGAAANVAYHVISFDKIKADAHGGPVSPLAVTVIVSSLAPVMLGVVAHLDALMRQDLAKARRGETGQTETFKTQTRAARLMGLVWSRVKRSLTEAGETETQTAKVQTQSPVIETTPPVPVRTETPAVSTKTIETPAATEKVAKTRTATVSSLTGRSSLLTERLNLIKETEPGWLEMGGQISKKRIGEIIGLPDASGTQQKLRSALIAEAEAFLAAVAEVSDDANQLVSVG